MTVHELITLFSRYVKRINDIDITQMCGLAEGTADHTLKTTREISYFIFNQQETLIASNDIAMTACAAQAINTFCYYLVSVDLQGVVTVTKATDNTYALPQTPSGNVRIAAFKVVTDAATTFTSGTDDLGKAGITVTFFDIDCGIALQLINQAIARLEHGMEVVLNGKPYRVQNWDHMKVNTTIALSSGDYLIVNPIPNYKELINAHIVDSTGRHYPELARVEYDAALRCFPDLVSNKQRPLMISRVPALEATLAPDIIPTQDWIVRPTSDASYTLDMTAYQYSPLLDGVIYSTNWWTVNASQIALYGALVEAMPYLKDFEIRPEWEDRLMKAVASLAAAQRDEKVSGSKLNIRSPFVRDKGYYSYDDVVSGIYFE